MSGHDETRLVEEFFAARQMDLVEQPADDLTWQRITDRHRRATRGPRWARRSGAAAAAAAIVVGGYLAWPQAEPQTAPPSATTPTPSPSPGPTEDPVTEDLWGETPDTVPADFSVTRLSDAGEGHVFATGGYGSECNDDAACAALITSGDGGVTWEPVADLVNYWIDRVEFADDQTGYGWSSSGATLSLTLDGGRIWEEGTLPAERVWDVAVREDRVVVLAGTGCDSAGRCDGLAVAQAPVGQLPVAGDLVTGAAEGPFEGASLALSPSETFVVGERASEPATSGESAQDGDLDLVVERWQDERFESVAEPPECAAPLAFAAAADTDDVFLACRVAGSAGTPSPEVTLVSSRTGGRTWGGSGQVYAVPPGPIRVVASDADHLTVVTPDGALVSTDGGQNLMEPTGNPPTTSPDLAGLTAEPGGVLRAWQGGLVEQVIDPGYWESTDRGRSWGWVDLLP